MHFLKVAPRHMEAENTFCLVKKWCFHSGIGLLLIFTFFSTLKAGNTLIFIKMFIFIPEYLKKCCMYLNKLKRFQKLIVLELRGVLCTNICPLNFSFDPCIGTPRRYKKTSVMIPYMIQLVVIQDSFQDGHLKIWN